MQEEINKLLTFEIATTVRKQTKKQPLCKGGKADFFYHNTAENLPVERGKFYFFLPLVHDSTFVQLRQLGPLTSFYPQHF